MSEIKNNGQLKENRIIEGYIKLETGLHIGGNKDSLEIGGVDAVVIKDLKTGKPIIPGSSLKGKMRSSLEYLLGLCDRDKKNPDVLHIHASIEPCNDKNCPICVIFGSSKNELSFKTRLIVRDSIALEEESIYTEIKMENALTRVNLSATPRKFERVPAGTTFPLELVYSIYDQNNDRKLFSKVFEALTCIEHSYLGGQGSRGYGKVKFYITKITAYDNAYYKNEGKERVIFENEKGVSPSEVRKKLYS
ncbi:MAG: type III-A CRISPR-associated RAMP protein Csm3 [Candidatus Heimdallarchaeum endolithica]|uniref:CRISPR system Cms endoribonuclease Csm3 n=1 Tax=Candidatus Heimdallarchaeum endolithica TaxID=2876572 RepID=A0A9Y1FP34_9ARCH|nr:MAG: type III-A CRISPR-associated RAMP protein Csm3 [Candidatus Heimdallarchaeum endolithica]